MYVGASSRQQQTLPPVLAAMDKHYAFPPPPAGILLAFEVEEARSLQSSWMANCSLLRRQCTGEGEVHEWQYNDGDTWSHQALAKLMPVSL